MQRGDAVRRCALALLLLAGGCHRPDEERLEWMTMGTIAAVQCPSARQNEVRPVVRDAFDRVSDEFNAFDPASAINRLGACTDFGRPCWDFAFRLKEETDGAFDPYWRRNGKLDFGAVAKGFAVDVAAEELLKRGFAGWGGERVLLDLGGNLKAVRGIWEVGIKDGGTFTLSEGEACATSATYYRGDHIRDARTGAAVTNRPHSVTVVHPTSAMTADALSTVLFILGPEKGGAFVRRHYPEARVIWQ